MELTTVSAVALHGSSLHTAGLQNITSSVIELHPACEKVHLSVAQVPDGIPVTVEVGDVGVVIVAVPATTVQIPVHPGSGVLPASVKVPHADWSDPAFGDVIEAV